MVAQSDGADARSVLASHLLASAQMLLPDLTQQAEALPRPIAAVSVWGKATGTRPLSRPLPIFDYILRRFTISVQ